MTTVAQPAVERTKTAPGTRIAAYQMTDYLERLGVEVVFGLCGHTVIGLLDALGKSRIRFVSTRHEQIAAHAADGYARATGKPGVMLSHLGPGLTNAATGVANAALDSIPMVVIAGDVQSYFRGRHPHQEVNLHQDGDQFAIYRPFCKRVYRVESAADLPRVLERAFHLSQTGRPGPVLVDVPMDVFSADLPVDAFSKVPAEMARPTIDAATAARIVDALARAERPVLYAGGGVLSGRATAELAALAEALEVPVAHTLMGKGCLHENNPLLLGQTGFWGLPVANDTCRNADVIRCDRDPSRRSELELVGSAFHVLHPADDAHSHRRGRRRDWPELPDRARRCRGREGGARSARGRGEGREAPRPRTGCGRTSRAAARNLPRTGPTNGRRINSPCGRSGF